ncbi:hypothetical protein EZS27_017301 [termite gut metagenome]|uniref:Uncharacterized protein n=1 Tax=termite gut metagenome TaxID=433724 RepID=A0A5J4RMP0_9ZZZZ
MSKKEELKSRMKGGMDELIRSTLPEDRKEMPKKDLEDREVHCNFVMSSRLHRKLKLLATQRGESLKTVLEEYLEKVEQG